MSVLRTRRRLLLFAALVLAQAIFVLAVVVREERRLGGLEIVLETQPVDPRDPLRGDYVILRYAAENLDAVPAPRVEAGDRVYIEFLDSGRYWEPEFVHRSLIPREEWRSGQAFVRARVESASPLRVRYEDLEAYFIPQGTGDPPAPPDVFVSVTDEGLTRIKRLEIDGVQWPNETVSQDQVAPQTGTLTPRDITSPEPQR